MEAKFNNDALKRLKFWITEREAVRLKKEAGKQRPWTKDPIIGKYRFCNVRRNDDVVTRWIHENWLKPMSGDPDLWFAMVVARLVNWPDTLRELAPAVFYDGLMSVKWQPKLFVRNMHARKGAGHKVFSGAYIVSTNGRTMDKAEYLAQCVLDPLWLHRGEVRPSPSDTLATFHRRLTTYDGLGSFMAAQVVADIKYDIECPLLDAADWYTWAAPGPGSKRGMLRLVYGDLVDGATLSDRVWSDMFAHLFPQVMKMLPVGALDSAQDLQNCLCEFDKYERVRLGQGTPRSLYTPA